MRFIPTHCDGCQRSSLSPENVVRHGTGCCATCGQPMQTLPGESYLGHDLPLFQQLESAISQASLSGETIAFLRAELSRASQGTAGRGLRSIIATVPELAVVDTIVGPGPDARRKAEGMLAVLLDGLRRSRSKLVTVPESQVLGAAGH